MSEEKTADRRRPEVLLAGGGIAPGPHRVHPAHMIISTLRLLAGIFIAFVFGLPSVYASLSYADLDAGLFGVILLGGGALFLVITVLAIVFAYLSYRRFLWEITESDIHIYSGIIFKKQVHIPFARVQSIDFNATVIDRILGLVKLKIETAGGASNKGVLIPALKLGEAEALRAEVFARKRGSEQRQEAALRQKIAEAKIATGKMPTSVEAEAEATPRFDPQTGQPLPSVPAPAAAAVPRFDPQTGALLPGAFPAPVAGEASKADALVQGVGDEVASLRGVFAEEYREEAPVEYEYGLRAKELLLASLSGDRNIVVFTVFVGVLAQLWQFIANTSLGDKTLRAVGDVVTGQTTSTVITLFVVTFVIIFIAALFLGVLSTAISYGAFKARRRGGRIEVERGLLSRQYKGVSISRIQAVELRQGFIRRLIGYTELKLLTIDSADAGNQQQNAQALQESGLTVHPFIKLSRVPEVLSGLLPELNNRPAPEELRHLPLVSLRRSLIRKGIIPTLLYALIGAAITALFLLFSSAPDAINQMILVTLWILLALLSLLGIIGSILWYRHAAYAHNLRVFTVRQGSYGMVTTIVPRRKIQWAATLQNPLQRFSGVATISATTAAGTGGTTLTLRDVAADEANEYLDWLRPSRRHDAASRE
jgi:putative membrane protein